MLCKPANLILLVSIAGVIFHVLTGQFRVVLWWTLVGILGAGTFQGLCMSEFENVAWVLMLIPVMVVCFFFAVALLASSMRIKNEIKVPCGPGHVQEGCKEIKRPTCKPKEDRPCGGKDPWVGVSGS